MYKQAAATLSIGSVIFLIAAFMPISIIYAERDVQAQIARVQSSPTAWAISQILFALGSIIVVAGLTLFTFQLRSTSATLSGYLGLAAIALGTLCWVVIVYERATLPPQDVFGAPTFGWLFIGYTVLTQAALIAYGFAFLQAGYPRWLGLGTIISTTLLCVAYLIFKDMPPFAYYVITLAIGIRLLFWQSEHFSLTDNDVLAA
jgi:hypothetical protein